MSVRLRSLRVSLGLLGSSSYILRRIHNNSLAPSSSFYTASSHLHLLRPSSSYRGFCSSSSQQRDSFQLPSKETLFYVDWILENVVPNTLKTGILPFLDICLDDLSFEDRLYNHKFSKKSDLLMHVAKIKLYFRYRSPFNKVEKIGSCIYEDEDVVVLLWRLSTLQPSVWTYLPSLITRKEPKTIVIEGALDVHVNSEGMVYKMINRKITVSDREDAKAMEAMKTKTDDARKKVGAKEIHRASERLLQEEKRRGIL
ncbi:hypothetical protein KIN20_001929 [Parelaphostrongylus tenuis]|uniref:Uncharacterized protein n=1 Tax=Parelaphostrongylus tenuis TaxID=148309 RepID=A0AAD5MG26_PARTN|nr:hypothetical protein KIN20_001929 [Parelaphostrongylus tenuis]